MSDDWIQQTIAARAEERELTAYAVAELCRTSGHDIDRVSDLYAELGFVQSSATVEHE